MNDIARSREYEKRKHDTIMKIVNDALGTSQLLSSERAAELTSLCSEVSSTGKAFNANLWCSAIGESVVGKGTTVLAAVLDAHAKSNALKGQSDGVMPVSAQSVARQAARTAFAVAEGASSITLNVQQLTAIIDSATEIYRLADEPERLSTLCKALEHGDQEHREWLKQAIEAHLAGRPVERPHGKGTTAPLSQHEACAGDAYATGYGDGFARYPSREAEFRTAGLPAPQEGLNARRLEHYWRYCNVLSHPSYFGFAEWLKRLDEDIAERTPEEAPRAAGAAG